MWNQVEILDDEPGGQRCVHYGRFDDAPFEVVASYYTRNRNSDDCTACSEGRCLQRVMNHPAWIDDVVIHDVQEELS